MKSARRRRGDGGAKRRARECGEELCGDGECGNVGL